MVWKCIVCETVNRDISVMCEVCDAIKPGVDPSSAAARREIACVKLESRSTSQSIEEYIYEIRSPSRILEKHILKASRYVKWFAFIAILGVLYFVKIYFK